MILARIRASLATLRPSERRVAERILAQPSLSAAASIKAIAASADVSEPTVMRFCRAIGCMGVQDLKQQLAHDLARRTPLAHAPAAGSAAPAAPLRLLAAQVIERAFAALFELEATLAPAALERAVDLLASAERVLLFGAGAAAAPAAEAAARLVREGVLAEAVSEAGAQLELARAAGPGVLVVLLAAGDGEDVLLSRAAEAAKAAGAMLIGALPERAPALSQCEVALPLRGAASALAADATALALRVLLRILLLGREAAPAPAPAPEPGRS